MNFANGPTVNSALEEFFGDSDVQGLFRFIEGGLQTWFPEHYASFHRAIDSTQTLHPELKTPVPNTCFPASTVNVGERVVCLPHRDSGNRAAGICADYVDGEYDDDMGGHLVFHEARRIIKLRKGGVALFPSAIVTHENIDIGPDERRFSITGYFPGGIDRFLAAGGRTLTEWKRLDPAAAALHESQAEGASRWESGCAQFKTPAELVQFWQARATEASLPGHS
ncbi:hypothetical protein M407DRAFT_220514 [Tulasnella calospora MUT 4182]|uniref:Uncharacterized protein n=1 Tax=Tulasnella calospora MUT 4182 TaxID=1051891 RepID=A0A0C3LGD0_9AGAM|nr:hypothetical protein M407DRAFT_220514 [Tulasnella calospora MUT 4182]